MKTKLNLLFSTPVVSITEPYDLSDEEKNYLTSQEDLYQTTGGTLYSKDCYILDHKSQYYFKKYIMKHVRDFAYHVLKINQSIEIYMTNSWVNYNDQYTTHIRHNHSNSLISGIFYIDGADTFKTTFFRQGNLLEWDLNYTESNIFNTDQISIESEKNNMVIFPSSSYHEAPINMNEEKRISLSFNIWIRGEIGSNRMCTKLKLK
jgi:uncharacterized protein (TIGR02466 family)|tara:strand:+ start:645 stop:1259 length:615 start_codon:yes stop_codon:yes gene_type:complete